MFILNNRFDEYVIHIVEMPSFVEAGNFCQSLSFCETDDEAHDHVCFEWMDNLAGVEAVALVGGPLSRKENLEVRRAAEFKGAKCVSFCSAEDDSRTQREFLAAGSVLQRGSIQEDKKATQERKKAIQKRKKELQKRKKARQRKEAPWWRFW